MPHLHGNWFAARGRDAADEIVSGTSFDLDEPHMRNSCGSRHFSLNRYLCSRTGSAHNALFDTSTAS
jgi:hypothetical protein